MEHLHHFDLSHDPFQNEPDLRFYFASSNHRDVQLRLDRGLRQHKGLCVLTGEGGTGKTLLARRILDTLEEEVFDANLMVMLAGAADAESVLSRFARQVGVEAPSDDRSGLLAQIYEQLAIVREEGRQCVLILDDAQILKREAMAEVGGLLNLEYEDRRLLSLLLVGLPELDVTISHDSSLAQRVDVRVQLQPLDLQNAAAYLLHRLSVVGGRDDIFPESAISSLHKFGRGRPRLLNTLADNALFEAYLEGALHVDSAHVERAAADLGIGLDPGTTYQSIPTPRGPSEAPAGPALGHAAGIAPPAPEIHAAMPASAEPLAMSDAAPAEETSVAAPGDEGELDLAALLEADDPDDELGVLSLDAPLPEETTGARDPGAGLPEALHSFAATNSPGPASADATRVSLGDETIVGAAPGPKTDDEIDDLFVELIEE